MTIELHDAVNGDGLFDVQSEAFEALDTLFTAAATTIPPKIEAFLAQFQLRADASDLDVAATMEGLARALASWQASSRSLSARVQANLRELLMALVAADAEQPEDTLSYALKYLIDQMITDGDYVAANIIALGLTPDGGNVGDLAIAYSELRGDGQVNQNVLDETVRVTIASTSGPVLRFRSPLGQPNRLGHDWPLGSGANASVLATSPAASLLSNGDFEDTTIADTPDNWMVHVGTPGTTVKVTAAEVQTIIVSGTPTGGSYLVQWTDPDSIVRSTVPLAYNASGSAVQTALRAIPGLGAVTVATTGTSPNYTHTITLHGAAGDSSQFTSVNDLIGGAPAIAHATPTPASAGSYRGRALEFDSDGAEVTALYHALTLATETVYFCHLRVKRVGATAAGEVRIEIVDGIGGTVIADGEANDAELILTAASISTASHDSEWFSFRLPAGQAQPVYLRIRISTAVDNTASIFFDEVAVVQATRLYNGGPYVAAFAGATAPHPDDAWSLVVVHDRSGVLQEWYNRVFDMADLDLLLPVSGTGLIPPWTPGT